MMQSLELVFTEAYTPLKYIRLLGTMHSRYSASIADETLVSLRNTS